MHQCMVFDRRRCLPASWRRADRLRIDRRRQSTPSSLADIDHHVSQQLAAIATSRRQPQPLLPHRRRPTTTHSSLTPTSHTERRHARLRLRHCNEYSSPHQQIDRSTSRSVSQLTAIASQLRSLASIFHVNIHIKFDKRCLPTNYSSITCTISCTNVDIKFTDW